MKEKEGGERRGKNEDRAHRDDSTVYLYEVIYQKESVVLGEWRQPNTQTITVKHTITNNCQVNSQPIHMLYI